MSFDEKNLAIFLVKSQSTIPESVPLQVFDVLIVSLEKFDDCTNLFSDLKYKTSTGASIAS